MLSFSGASPCLLSCGGPWLARSLGAVRLMLPICFKGFGPKDRFSHGNVK